MRALLKDFSQSSIVAGLVAVMVGFASSAVIVYQAALTAGASPAQAGSWLLICGFGAAITTIGLSIYYRMPILSAWSTPGAALLAATPTHHSLSLYTGAFIVAALLNLVLSMTGLFERFIKLIPKSLASAMLAGIILHFCMNTFTAMQQQFILVSSMFLLYLIGKRLFSRYVILLVLMLGVGLARMEGLLLFDNLHFIKAIPIFVMPEFSWSAILAISLPLLIVNTTSQNIPGLSVIRAAGFEPPAKMILGINSLVNCLLAPFGNFSLNLAAITAGICLSPEAEPVPEKRYTSAVAAGVFYLFQGLFGATLVALFISFPKELTFALAGLALLGTLGSSLKSALEDDNEQESALITFLVASSGISLFGVSAAMWALMAGALSLLFLKSKKELKLAS